MENEQNTDPEYDIEAMVKDVGDDLFGGQKGTSSETGNESEAQDDPSAPASPTSTPASTPSTPAKKTEIDPVAQLEALNKELPLPKSIKKEQEGIWNGMSREQRELFTKREADISRGIQMYSEGHQKWDQLIKPYEPLLQQHPNVNPVQLLGNLMDSHLTLLGAKGEAAKTAKIQELFKAYGISIEGLNQQAATPQVDFSPINQRLDTVEQFLHKQTLTQFEAEVQRFASDPANKHFDEVSEDIHRLIQTGAAKDLRSAYDQAIWINPTVRQKVLADQNAEAARVAKEQQAEAERVRRANRKSASENDQPAPRKSSSMDDTINAVLQKHYGQTQ